MLPRPRLDRVIGGMDSIGHPCVPVGGPTELYGRVLLQHKGGNASVGYNIESKQKVFAEYHGGETPYFLGRRLGTCAVPIKLGSSKQMPGRFPSGDSNLMSSS